MSNMLLILLEQISLVTADLKTSQNLCGQSLQNELSPQSLQNKLSPQPFTEVASIMPLSSNNGYR